MFFFSYYFLSEMKRRERKCAEGKVYVIYFLQIYARICFYSQARSMKMQITNVLQNGPSKLL